MGVLDLKSESPVAVTVIVKRTRNSFSLTPRAEWLTLALLCVVLLGQLFLIVGQLSQTADEATHLYAGYRYLKCGDLTVSPEHPPLAKIVAAAPLLPMNLTVDCSPFEGGEIQQVLTAQAWLYNQNWRPALARARIAVSVFALALCLIVWMAARRMFDLATAIAATVLLIFEPNVLAYGALVMTDIAVTCMLLFAVFAFYLWVRNRTTPFLLLTGLATGLALLAKHSAVGLVPILCVLAVADALIPHAGARLTLQAVLRNLLAVGLICTVAVGIVWVGYGMRFAASPAGVQLQQPPADATSKTPPVLLAIKNYHLLPEAYLQGFVTALSISGHSGPAFLDARIYPQPPWFSVPFYLLIRNTPPMLALFLMAVFGTFIAFGKHPREVLFLLIPAGIFLAVCMRSNMIGGIRYLLPAFPFLLIAVAAGCVELARRVRWVRYAVPCLIVLHGLSSLHAYPNYLSYANEFWGGPANAYKYLPWLDTGQAYPEAKAYLERHPAENCWFITGWQWDPKFYGIPCQTFGLFLPNQIPPRVQGTVIVSSTLLTDVRLPEEELAAPFKNIAPNDKIGGSALLVYEGDFDTRLAAAKSERDLMVRASSAGQPAEALLHGKLAVELAPNSALAHSYLCALLAQTGQLDAALNEGYAAQKLMRQDPLREEPGRKQSLKELETWIASTQAATKK
jgi:hypothetical protein